MGKSNAANRAAMAERMQYRKNKFVAPVGGIFLLLGLIGAIALLIGCLNFTRDLLDNSGEKEEFEQVILPVLMFDPATFEKPTDLDSLFLLRSSLWATMLGEKRESYQFDDIGRLTVPTVDVDMTCARLFGPDVQLNHQSFGDYEVTYVYDEERKSYFAPVTGQVGYYSPSVEQVVKDETGVYVLTVGYIPPASAWTKANAAEDGKIRPEKRMLYLLNWVKDHYQLMAIRDLPVSSTGAISLPTDAVSEIAQGS